MTLRGLALSGWIKLHRRMMSWEWYQDSNMVHLFLHMLMKANHEPGKWRGIQVNRGQFVSGRKALSKEIGMSERSIRTCIKRLKSTNELTTNATNRFTLYTIVNWDTYQIDGRSSDQHTDQPCASKRPASDQQVTTNKNDKNDKNEKEAAEAAAFAVFGAPPAQLADWIELHGAWNTKQAIYQSQDARKPNYTEKILNRWAKEGYPEKIEKKRQQSKHDESKCREIDDDCARDNGTDPKGRSSLEQEAVRARKELEGRST